MRMVAGALVASLALVSAYLVLGGASYAPAKVADPCAPRDWRHPGDFQRVAEQIVLSALDGAACELGASREEVVLAFESHRSLERFARKQGISTDRLERVARSALVRTIDDAERAAVVDPAFADELRDIARRISLAQLLELPGLLPVVENLFPP